VDEDGQQAGATQNAPNEPNTILSNGLPIRYSCTPTHPSITPKARLDGRNTGMILADRTPVKVSLPAESALENRQAPAARATLITVRSLAEFGKGFADGGSRPPRVGVAPRS
jgi:hypothetical protein